MRFLKNFPFLLLNIIVVITIQPVKINDFCGYKRHIVLRVFLLTDVRFTYLVYTVLSHVILKRNILPVFWPNLFI